MGDVVQSDDTISLGALGWRQLFTDPLLQQLIEKTLQNNTDVQQALLTVQQAQNDLKSAQLGWLPILSFDPSGKLSRFNGTTTRSYELPMTFTWQAGIFGQVTTKKRLAKAKRQQMDDYRQAVQTALAANVASTYYELVMLDRELQILQETQVVWDGKRQVRHRGGTGVDTHHRSCPVPVAFRTATRDCTLASWHVRHA